MPEEPQEVEKLRTRVKELESWQTLVQKESAKEEQLRTLTKLSAILNSTLDPKEVQKRAMEAATELMNAQVGSLLLVDEKNNELYFEVALGEKGAQVKAIRLKIGEGIAGWVAQHGEPLIVEDVQKDPRFAKKADKKSSFVTRNMICVPVRIKDKTIGVLQAINKEEGAFAQEHLEQFQMLANKVGIAIENARLMEDLRQTFYETAEALAEAIEKRDPYTGGHTKRVLTYSMASAEYMGMGPQETAINELQKYAGIQFDPDVVRAFIDAYKDGKIIYCRFKNCEEKKEGPK